MDGSIPTLAVYDRFKAFRDPHGQERDFSRQPETFESPIPEFYYQQMACCVASYVRIGNPIGEFPIETRAQHIQDRVEDALDDDRSWFVELQVWWYSQQSTPHTRAALRKFQEYFFGQVWVARDCIMQLLLDYKVAGRKERRYVDNHVEQGTANHLIRLRHYD